MDNFNYTEVKSLFEKYQEKYFNLFNEQQTDLAKEFSNNLSDLEQISNDIVNLNSQLTNNQGLIPDTEDVIEFGGYRIKLNRADPNIPIQPSNVTKAYSRGDNYSENSKETKAMERRLERLASEFYRVAHRLSHIAESLPCLGNFKAKSVRIIRNHLIEHPEGKDSGITYDSFSYSMNEGPYVKGLRVGNKTKHMDKGFKVNQDELLIELKKCLLEALRAS